MKQTTQKFLAKFLVLLLVLGLVPEVWGTFAQAASTSNATTVTDNPYLWCTNTGTKVTSGSVALSWNGTRTLTVGGITDNTSVAWSIGGITIKGTYSSPTYIDGYLRAYVDNNGDLVIYTNGTYTGASYSVYAAVDGKSYSCTVYTSNNTYSGNTFASVTVYGSYSLGSVDDAGGASIVSQLQSYNYGYYGYNYYGFASLRFNKDSDGSYGSINASTATSYTATQLSNLVFTPGTTAGTASFPVTVTLYTSSMASTTTVSGYITFNTNGTVSTGDITYSAGLGDTVYFALSDFESFYSSKISGGTLSYVTFSTPSTGTGTLYSDGTRLSSTSYCYASPTSSRLALDGVYFTPSGTTATKAGTVRIAFTAVGTRSYYSSNSTVSGAVVINYLNGTAKDITYTPVGGSVKLNANDFTAIYRDVMGATAPTDLTIQFQEVPTYGTLTYKNSSSSSSSAVTLKTSNVKSYRFTTRTTGTNQLGDVTYTNSNSARSDSIEYIAYTSGVARFTGKVVFNPNSVTVTVYKSCGSTGVAFALADFTSSNPTVLASTAQITFTIPANGTLTYAGSTVTNNSVSVPVSMMSQVFYRPNANFIGTDRIAFVCLNASGSQVGTGQMTIAVSGSTTSTGISSVSQFTDVPANAWYYSALSSLVSRGLVQGVGNNKADPEGTLDYGQALKMILLAAGYPAQQELPGNNWAENYKTFAVSNGFISESVSMNDPIPRDAVVELAARALKIAPVTTNSPFSDSNNGYAIALYRTSPQIITGYPDGTFGGSDTLVRQEVWSIIYKMLQYADNQYNSQMPDGI